MNTRIVKWISLRWTLSEQDLLLVDIRDIYDPSATVDLGRRCENSYKERRDMSPTISVIQTSQVRCLSTPGITCLPTVDDMASVRHHVRAFFPCQSAQHIVNNRLIVLPRSVAARGGASLTEGAAVAGLARTFRVFDWIRRRATPPIPSIAYNHTQKEGRRLQPHIPL
jgi:hypothetical protein